MRWEISCNNSYYDLPNMIEANDELSLKEEIQDCLSDQFWEIICDITEEYASEYQGPLDISNIEMGLLSFLKETIEKKYSEVQIKCNGEGDAISLTLSRILVSYLDWCWDGSDTVYPKVGTVVEKALEKYVAQSIWNIALTNDSGAILWDCNDWPTPTRDGDNVIWIKEAQKYYPIIWYGPEKKQPDQKWVIWDEANQTNTSEGNTVDDLWFSSDSWYTIESLVDDTNDAFLIWYTAECGYVAPDMDEIREACPIMFDQDEPNEIPKKRVAQYFFNRFLESRYGEIEITASVYSEKANVSISFGLSFYPVEDSIEDFGTDWIFEGMGDSFWENAYEFEEGAQCAYDLSNNSDISYSDALFQVFGKFSISFECNASEIELDFKIDEAEINEAMYEMLPDIYVE